MKFGYTIIYVQDVPQTTAFYEQAFGLKTRFLHESNAYAEMETGGTTLAFAAESMAEFNGLSIRPNNKGETPAGFEIAFISETPETAYDSAVQAGAEPIKPPEQKPWGQTVAYVKDINGCIVEIGSPVTAT